MTTMRITVAVGVGVIALGAVSLQAGRQGASPAAAPAASSPAASQVATDGTVPPPRALVDKYCVTCHNARLKTANLLLDQADATHPGASAEVWEKVVGKLRSRAMPPVGLPRPDNATYDAVASWLETELDKAAAVAPNPGRPGIHRLNRAEYANAVRDLLAVQIDPATMLPPDVSVYGFDNIAEALAVTPGLLERYMAAAAKVSRLAIGDPTIPAGFDTYPALKNLWQDDQLTDAFPFGSRGGASATHQFPVDGDYVLKVNLSRTYTNQIRGLAQPNLVEIRVDGTRVGQFTVGGKYSDAPARGRGNAEDAQGRADYERLADVGLEVRVPIKAGAHDVSATIVKTSAAIPEGVGPDKLPIWNYAYASNANTPMGIEALQIGGPYNGTVPTATASRERLLVCQPTGRADELSCATKIVSRLARRAFRRSVTASEVQGLLGFYKTGAAHGGFETGIKAVVERVLVDPDFLFRMEREPAGVAPGTAYRVSDVELASRLSFFLWSSLPDDTLLDLATTGRLHEPAVLEQQVRRMLVDPRARASLVENFFSEWLQVRNLRSVEKDTSAKFPDFEDNLREAMREETERFLADQLEADRPVLDLLTANYTFLNERLAKHYGIPNIYGSHFRRVTLTDPNRGGLLGQASILTVTAVSNRTSPTVRGKWLLENFLAAPMPPPPPNVPALAEASGPKPKTVRETLELHRKNPVCASCHARMDPLGFGLENFDGIGRWRTMDGGNAIDASGVLLDGTKFQGPVELRSTLMARKEQFVTAVTGKLLTYALGRHVEYYDAPAVRQIVRTAAAGDYKWSALIVSIIKSQPFGMRRSRES